MQMHSFRLLAAAAFALLCAAGCNSEHNRSVISVAGVGTVMAQPDTVQMQLSLNKTAATTRQAQEEVSAMVRRALKILEEAGIEGRNISTASLRFNPEYEWTSPRRVLIGQRAEQVITFSVGGINAGGAEMVSKIIDQLIEIDGIELQQMYFTVKETGDLFARSRELAYQKALEKAEQYAKLSGLKIARAVAIVEEGNSPVSSVYNRAMNNKMMAFNLEMDASAGSTVLPTGEMEITSRISVEFLLK